MADNTVRADTPDPTKYHQNVGGVPGTMLPRSSKDGQSLAFDPNKPRTVIVDPGEEGGGFQLDISTLSQKKSRFNSAAVRAEVIEDPSTFYRELSQESEEKAQLKAELTTKLQEKLKEPAVPEPIKPIDPLPPVGPVVEKPTEEQMEKQYNAMEQSGAIDQLLAEAKAEQAAQEAAAAAQPQNQEIAQIRESVNKQGEAINALIGLVKRGVAQPAEAPPKPEHVMQVEEDVEKDMAAETEFVEGMASLQIPFLEKGKPKRPQYETYFEMGKLGTMAARYHAVVPGQDCLALVYDTRFEDGFQYLPPNLGEERVTVSVPKLDNATYSCSSLGLHWSLGCLDIVILIKHGDME